MYEISQFLEVVFFVWVILFFISLFSCKIRQIIFRRYSRKKIAIIWVAFCLILISINQVLQLTDSYKEREQQALIVKQQKDLEKQEKDKQKIIEELQKNNPTAKFFDLKSQEEVDKIETIYNSVGINVKEYAGKQKYNQEYDKGTGTAVIYDKNYVATIAVIYDMETKNISDIEIMSPKIFLLENGKVLHQLRDVSVSNDEYYFINDKVKDNIKKQLKSPDDAIIYNDIYIGGDGKIHVDSTVKAKNSFGVYVLDTYHSTYNRK